MPRFLTKSRFKLGHECPTKLFYTKKPEKYADAKEFDEFLQSLAEGGLVVGELAKLYFPGGREVQTLDYEQAVRETNTLLENGDVTIFEAAICYQNLFVRVDVLVKTGNQVELIEVKSKSIDLSNGDPFRTNAGNISATWQPYLLDVGFQKFVLEKAFPDLEVHSYLMCVDKNQPCTVDRLYQKFHVRIRDNGRKLVTPVEGVTIDDICQAVLARIRVDDHINQLFQNDFDGRTFPEYVQWLSGNYQRDTKITPTLGKHCRSCEFRCSEQDLDVGLKDGFRECWSEVLGWQEVDFDQPLIFELNDFRQTQQFIDGGLVKISDLTEADMNSAPDNFPGMSPSQRRALHVRAVRQNQRDSFLDRQGIQSEMVQWKFPLHFIDFETVAPAVPIHRGLRPYQNIAFQFSHHSVEKNGQVSHIMDYLNTSPGTFPNFDFLRNLKNTLENDDGTIFRYADHENTILNHIIEQLDSFGQGEDDYRELRQFAQTITRSTGGNPNSWVGVRNMVDLRRLVARYYFHPLMKGSQSIKYVLPAVMNDSDYLMEKYSQPIYGSSQNGIISRNFENQRWVQFDEDNVIDPYSLLPNIFDEITNERWWYLEESNAIREGGAAMTAYLRLQYEDLPNEYRDRMQTGLLKYCELDTLAMVMIYECWREMVN